LCGLKEGAAVKAREKARKVHRREIKTNEKRAKKSKRAQILVRWALLFFSVVFSESVEEINIEEKPQNP